MSIWCLKWLVKKVLFTDGLDELLFNRDGVLGCGTVMGSKVDGGSEGVSSSVAAATVSSKVE